MRILDACCGSRMFWHEKELSFVDYQDNRSLSTTLCDGRKFEIKPSLIGDVTDMFYIKDGTYDMVVFDPPHLKNGGDNAWIILKYGRLPEEWKLFMKTAFEECFRVLKDGGTRSGLFFEIMRLLDEAEENKPRWIIAENVKNLLSIEGGVGILRGAV